MPPASVQPQPQAKVVYADDRAAAVLRGHVAELCRPEQGWQKVKHNASRTVYRGTVGGRRVYLKHFHGRWAGRLGGSGALKEMDFARRLLDCGVRTPQPLAACCDGPIQWICTLEVDSAVAGDVWHQQQLALPGGHKAIAKASSQLARMVAQMHAAGVLHHDLHCGNVLVAADASGKPALYLMDLHRMGRRRRLSRRLRAANLAQLLHDRMPFTTRTQRLRFLKHYLAEGRLGGSLGGWAYLVESFAASHSRRQFAKLDRRIMRTNRYFAALKLPGGWRGNVALAGKWKMPWSRASSLELTAADWRAALARPEELIDQACASGRIVKQSASGVVVAARIKVGPHELDVYIKRPRRKLPWKAPVDCFRASRPVRAFRLGHELLARRIATALPLACLERRTGRVLRDSILITEAVDAPDLKTFLDAAPLPAQTGQTPLSRQLLAELGRLLKRLHEHKFAHRDLKGSNLLIRRDELGRPQVVLIDLDGMRRRLWMSHRRRCQGLMRLNVSLLECRCVSHAGRLRMLLGYLRRPGGGPIAFKPYWRMLQEWSARKLQRQIQSRRNKQKALRGPA